MSLAANGKLPTPSHPNPSKEITIIRRARLTEAPQIGRIAARSYCSTPVTAFLNPNREKYYADYERGFVERAISRMLSPRSVTFVACTVEEPGRVVGYAQFVRLGDDAGARKLIREVGFVKRVVLWVFSWLFWGYCTVLHLVLGEDRSANKEAAKMFREWVKRDQEKFWESHEERSNRWHVQSCVVLEEWQRKGIGKRLMEKIIERVEREGEIVGLEASVKGEGLYKKLGFELLGRFNDGQDLLNEGDAGGLMMWSPKGWKERFGEN
jgi:ribosomal protein S18 acetylase RimI-like enzyme